MVFAPARQRLWARVSIGVQVLCLLAFAGYRIGAAVSYGGPAVWQDTEAYKAVAANGFFSAKLWAGSRAPLVPILLKLTGGYDGYGILQGVLGALAWSFLAFTVSRLVAGSWRRPLASIAVLGLAASPLVVMWDGSALSESPSLSMLALLCAAGIWLVRRFSWPRLGALGAAAICYCGLRDADIWMVGFLGVVLLGTGIAGVLRGAAVDERGARARLAENWLRARAPAAAGALLFAVALLTGAGTATSHRNLVNLERAFFVRVFPDPERVAWFSSQGMPQAKAIERQAATVTAPSGSAPVVGLDLTLRQWTPLRTWFEHDGLRTYGLFLAVHPGYDLTAPFASPRLTYNDAQGDLRFYQPAGYALASWVGHVFTPNRFVELSLALAAVVLAGVRGAWRSGPWRFVALFGVLGLVAMLLAWNGDGEEVTRHMVEGNVEARRGGLGALALALLVARPQGAKTADSGAAGGDGPSAQAPLDPFARGEAGLALVQGVGVVAEPQEGPGQAERL